MDSKNICADDIDFLFPFKAYDVQLGFMRSLYSTLQKGGIGILESPTGTGKSLSIICGALRWLKDEQEATKKRLTELLVTEEAVVVDDWFSSYADTKKKTEERLVAKEELDFIEKREAKIKELRESSNEKQEEKKFFNHAFQPHKRIKSDSMENEIVDENDNEDLLIEDEDKTEDSDLPEVDEREIPKIIYASRTHSQLLQFMSEFKKTAYAQNVVITCLGSRVSLCVNDSVKKLKCHRLINDKCSELLSGKTTLNGAKKSSSGCSYYNKSNIKLLQDNIFIDSLDIEDLAAIGKELKACPYYATRGSIPQVEMVLVPYNILLHKSTRESCGIRLKNNIVIIDEAHNLLDAINNMYSTEINGTILVESSEQLKRYHHKYKTRFSAKTVRYINLMLQILDSFIKYASRAVSISAAKKAANVVQTDRSEMDIVSIFSFLSSSGISHINFFDVVSFCDSSHIGNKLRGFASRDTVITNNTTARSATAALLSRISNSKKTNPVKAQEKVFSKSKWPSAFNSFVEFLRALTLPLDCGKMVCSWKPDPSQSYFRLLHLNPAIHFKDIVTESRSVILAGGTMSPISDFVEQLLVPARASREKICHFSFGHVVADENVSVLAVRSGPRDLPFDFRFESRQKPSLVEELGDFLIEISSTIPGGIVCFFPSYIYEQYVYTHLQSTHRLSKIEKCKKVFRESKDSSATEELLTSYARAIADPGRKGAMLFSVVGGKMSEGINFSDNLCRCVVMVGLPYAKKDKECLEKLSYLKSTFGSGEDNYDIMCMKAVNQSIGRAIRHKNDYAVILLLDGRYCQERVLKYLPAWMSRNISKPESFNSTKTIISNFFLNHSV